jgi:HEPN domain-containing protein
MQKTIDYWMEEAEEALKVADHLFEKKDFSYSLFFGHLAVEKFIKAIYIQKRNEHAPQIHNLVRLAEQAGIVMSPEQKEMLIIITAFNLESRYPDEKRSFRIKCTKQYTQVELTKIREVIKWLKSIMQS